MRHSNIYRKIISTLWKEGSVERHKVDHLIKELEGIESARGETNRLFEYSISKVCESIEDLIPKKEQKS